LKKKSESKIHLIWLFRTPNRTVGSQERTGKEPHPRVGLGWVFWAVIWLFQKGWDNGSCDIRIGYLIFHSHGYQPSELPWYPMVVWCSF
jgi:hypothetical protein